MESVPHSSPGLARGGHNIATTQLLLVPGDKVRVPGRKRHLDGKHPLKDTPKPPSAIASRRVTGGWASYPDGQAAMFLVNQERETLTRAA